MAIELCPKYNGGVQEEVMKVACEFFELSIQGSEGINK